MKNAKGNNVDQLVDAGLVNAADLSAEDQDIINKLSEEEIDAIISAGTKALKQTKAGEKVAKVSI